MNAPSVDMKDYLLTFSALALTFAGDLFVSEMPETPDECYALYDTGGFDPQPNYQYLRPTFQVRGRGPKGAYRTVYDKVDAIRNVLHATENMTINSTRYVLVLQIGDILAVGKDDNNRPIVAANFRCHRTGT